MFGLSLTEREKSHLTELDRTSMFLQMKKEGLNTFDVIGMMREYGNVRVTKSSTNRYWCVFVDLSETESIKNLMSRVQAKHGKVIGSI